MLLTTSLTACANKTILHPLPNEFMFIDKGQPAPADGVWMTVNYLEVIGNTKIDKSK